MAGVEIELGLTQIFREVLRDESFVLAPDVRLDDIPGWDSLKLVTAGLDAEARFGIELPTHELDRLCTVGDVIALIRRKLAGS